VLNNAVYFDEPVGRPFRICQSHASGTGHVCRNNLVHVPNHSGSRSVDDGNFASSNNLFVTGTSPFAEPIPDQGLSQPSDFQLAPGSVVVDAGYDYGAEAAGTWTDFGRRCRPAPGPGAATPADWDIGAWEYGAVDCLAVPEASGAALGCVAWICVGALRRWSCPGSPRRSPSGGAS
jgi:hypothetical protein